MNLSKSSYTKFCQCPKLLWLNAFKKEKAKQDPSLQRRFDEGSEAGDLAMAYFGEYKLVEERKEDGTLNIPTMLNRTQKCLAEGVGNICEASFQANGCFCAVDILHKQDDGYAIVEVKASTKVSEVYIWDISFQKWVLEQAGIKVTGTYIMHIDNRYVRKGAIDIHKLFHLEDVAEKVSSYSSVVPTMVARAKEVLELKDEPEHAIAACCNKPYECAFKDYCFNELRSIPTPSVFDLYSMRFDKACKLYDKGIVTFDEILASGIELSDKQQMQVLQKEYIDAAGIQSFLSQLWNPLYFLDFETYQTCLPKYDGMKPYQQIPFQYSLHYFEGEADYSLKTLKHTEYLADYTKDPRMELAERLIADIPDNACIIVYNDGFEKTRIAELAKQFPDLADQLLARRDNIRDLLDVFKAGYAYLKEMGGSFSIKSVLPAICPNDPEADYHLLEQVHNGGEATDTYLSLASMTEDERKVAWDNLLKYCYKDTIAMVKVWLWLVKQANG